ncbi:MAG: inactive transglutaminase family protein [Gammaproteobacteria bacterium]
MSNKHLYILSAILFLFGLWLFIYKVVYLGFPVSPGQKTNVWEIEVKVNFTANDRPVKAYLYVPRNLRNFSIINENFISRGYGTSINTSDGNRQVVWSIRRATGLQTLYYRAVVEKLEGKRPATALKDVKTQPSSYEGADLEAANAILQEARQKSADTLSLALQLLERVKSHETDDNVNLLLRGKPEQEKMLETMINILALENIPSRLAHGLKVSEQYGKVEPVSWLEVYADNQWVTIDPLTSQVGQTGDQLLLWMGTGRIIQLIGGQNLNVDINVNQTGLESISAASTREKVLHPIIWKYSLHSLPLDTQRVYSVLLSVPMGVFILVLLRNFIGIKTFGTFMPVLIALAFRETQLVSGLVLFSILVVAGLSIRFYLEKLKLLLVPRLAAVLIIVIILMLLLSIVSNVLGIESGLSVALFPMVIITMTIERMSIVWEEMGAHVAIYQGLGSLAAASIAFLVMNLALVHHLVNVFPELLFVVLSITLLFGRYSGYRLLELRRFKSLVGK